MFGSHPSRWILFLVVGALTAFGCAGTETSQGATGSLSLDLVLAGGVEIDAVDWEITGNGMQMDGTIDVSAPGSTASVEVFGLPPGDEPYVVELSALSVDKEVTCRGSAEFDVEVGVSTEVMVMLNCKLPQEYGGVRVNGKFNICAQLSKMVVSPLQTSVGNDISLFSAATDEEGDAIATMWSSNSGSIADPMATSTTYTCTEVGDDDITVLVTDDGGTYCMSMWTVRVTCVAGEGNPCDDVVCDDTGNECTTASCNPSTGVCEISNVDDGTSCNDATGACMDGQCVPNDLCMDVVCEDDGNECTTALCNPSTGQCETSNVDDGTSCGDGGACMGGTCIEADPCDEITCDDTGNECTVNVCNSQTAMCDEMNVPDGTECNQGVGACSAGVCLDNNLCISVDCTSANDCVQDGTCDPATGNCIAGDNQPVDTACTSDGGTVCDGAGACVACNTAVQCPDDGNECTAAACESNACVQNDVMDGQACDFGGSAGMCEAGTCVEAPQCVSPGDCNDGNPCTVGDCPDGMCVFSPIDGGSCDVSPGVPGTCSGGSCVGLCVGVDCSDGNECTDDLCTDGTCSNPPVMQGNACDAGGGPGSGACDGAGNCVTGCTVPAPVDAPGIPMACRNSFNQVVSVFPIDLLNVTADDCLTAGDPVNFDIDPVIALDTTFLQAAAETLCDLGTLLTSAQVTSAQVSIDAVAGATCTQVLSGLSPVPQTVTIDITLVSGSCGASGVVQVNSGVSLSLPPVTLACSALGAAGSDVPICSTGTVPLSINLTNPPPPPAYQETFVGVSVSNGAIQVAFACNTSSTTSPAPGTTIGCSAPNPAGQCAALPLANAGATPYPASTCDFTSPPNPPQDCGGFNCFGSCTTVPVAVDPSTVCATFTVE